MRSDGIDWADETRFMAKKMVVRIANLPERAPPLLDETTPLPSLSVVLTSKSRIVLTFVSIAVAARG